MKPSDQKHETSKPATNDANGTATTQTVPKQVFSKKGNPPAAANTAAKPTETKTGQ